MRPALLAALALVLTGCFQLSSVLTVRPDGSAVLREELTLSGMGLMMLASEAEDGDPWAALDLDARAAGLGEGVRLASFERAEDGFTAVYEVDDVGALTYTLDDAFGASDDVSELPLGYRFRFAPAADGAPAALRVFVPKPDVGKPGPPAAAEEATGDEGDAEAEAAIGLMRGFLEDARMTVAVEVDGEIASTTASFVDGPRVTLFDFGFDGLFELFEERPDLLQGDQPNGAAVFGLLNEVEGIRMQTPGTVRVAFR